MKTNNVYQVEIIFRGRVTYDGYFVYKSNLFSKESDSKTFADLVAYKIYINTLENHIKEEYNRYIEYIKRYNLPETNHKIKIQSYNVI